MTDKGASYYSPTPLDFLILEVAPDKGILGGVHWAGRPARHLRDDVNELLPHGADPVKSSTVMARLRSMKVAGHVEDFASHGSGRIWARTPSGKQLLGRKAAILDA